MYCPWDVVNYVAALLRKRNAKPKNYWMNTSGNDAVRKFFGRNDIDVSRKFETMLNGGIITEYVTDQLSYENAAEYEGYSAICCGIAFSRKTALVMKPEAQGD